MSTILLILALTAAQFGQSNTGELRFIVTDSGGLPLETAIELVSDANQLHQVLQTASSLTKPAPPAPGIRILQALCSAAN